MAPIKPTAVITEVICIASFRENSREGYTHASIPLIAAAKALFVYYYERNTGRRIVAPDGVFFKGVVTDIDGAVNPTLDAAAPSPQQAITLPSLNFRPDRQQTEEQKEAIRKRLEQRRERLERLRKRDDD